MELGSGVSQASNEDWIVESMDSCRERILWGKCVIENENILFLFWGQANAVDVL